jgi:hypothetical protein
MRYGSAGAFRSALETRLLAVSRETGRSLSRLRKQVVFDRLLARLLVAAPGRWILKGGLALDYRYGDRARTTKDIDLAMAGDEQTAIVDLLTAQALDLGDFLDFSMDRTGKLDELQEGAAVRFRVRAELAGRVFEEFLLDVGFDLPSNMELETLRGPALLTFADIEPVEAPALPLELQIAEKLHAYTRGYGAAGVASSRVKDLVDLALTGTSSPMDAGRLRDAIDRTFMRRGRHGVPETLPSPPRDWRVPYARMADEVGLAPDLDVGFEVASLLLNPILGDTVRTGTWVPATQRWAR